MRKSGLAVGLILGLALLAGYGPVKADVFDFIPDNSPVVIEIKPGEVQHDPGIRTWVTKVLGQKDATVGKTGLNIFSDFPRIVLFSAPEANAPDQSKMSGAVFECSKDLKASYNQMQKDPDMAKEAQFHSILGYDAVSATKDLTWKMVLLNRNTLLLGNQVLIDAALKVAQKKVGPISKHLGYTELRKRPEASMPIWGAAIPTTMWRQEAKGSDLAKPLGDIEFLVFGVALAPKPKLVVTIKLADAKAMPDFRKYVGNYVDILKTWSQPAPKVRQMVDLCSIQEEGQFLTATIEADNDLYEQARQQWEKQLQK